MTAVYHRVIGTDSGTELRMARLEFDEDDLRPLVEKITKTVIAELEAKYGDQLAYSETRAAKLLDMSKSQLKAERDAGRLQFKRIGERGIRYSRQHLMEYLSRDEKARERS